MKLFDEWCQLHQDKRVLYRNLSLLSKTPSEDFFDMVQNMHETIFEINLRQREIEKELGQGPAILFFHFFYCATNKYDNQG